MRSTKIDNPYGWFWEDEEELMLPHARHIVINDDDGTEYAVIVLRNDHFNAENIARVEKDATRICMGLHLMDVIDNLY
jgi:hypothetical protein